MRRSIMFAIAGTAVIATTIVLRAGNRAPTTDAPPTSPPASSPTIMSAPTEEAGPLDVALRAVRLTGEIATAGFITRNDLIESVASKRFAPTLRSSSGIQLDELTTAIGAAGIPPADVVWNELPLTARVVDTDVATARVEVWSVLIVGVPGHGSARQVWRTSTIGLVHESGGWRVDSWTATPGPTPSPATNGAVSDLPSVVEVLSWPPATAGVT